MSNDTTNAEIDGLARQIEIQIQKNEARLEEVGEFDGKWRRMAEAEVPDASELFG
jgi:hypothetical protein